MQICTPQELAEASCVNLSTVYRWFSSNGIKKQGGRYSLTEEQRKAFFERYPAQPKLEPAEKVEQEANEKAPADEPKENELVKALQDALEDARATIAADKETIGHMRQEAKELKELLKAKEETTQMLLEQVVSLSEANRMLGQSSVVAMMAAKKNENEPVSDAKPVEIVQGVEEQDKAAEEASEAPSVKLTARQRLRALFKGRL